MMMWHVCLFHNDVISHLTIPFLLPRLCCMFSCPVQSLNYAPIAVGVVLLVSGGWWVAGARKWFNGPRRTFDEVEDPKPDNKGGLVSNKDADEDPMLSSEVQLHSKAEL